MTKLKIRGPLDGALRATFDGKSKKELSRPLSETSLLVLLSIAGNEYCTGDFLRATIDQAIASHKQSIFLVADEIYWHNLKGFANTESQETALKLQSIEKGSAYLQANLNHFLKAIANVVPGFNPIRFYAENSTQSIDAQIQRLNEIATSYAIPFQIIRWKEWIARADSTSLDTEILRAKMPTLDDTIYITADDFARRHSAQKPDSSDLEMMQYKNASDIKQLWRMRSHDYLLDEGPKIFGIAATLGINFIAYPGRMVKPFECIQSFYTTLLAESHELLSQATPSQTFGNWLEINFRRIPRPVSVVTHTLAQTAQASGTNNMLPLAVPKRESLGIFHFSELIIDSADLFFEQSLSPKQERGVRRSTSCEGFSFTHIEGHTLFGSTKKARNNPDVKSDYSRAESSPFEAIAATLLERLRGLPAGYRITLVQNYIGQVEQALSMQEGMHMPMHQATIKSTF